MIKKIIQWFKDLFEMNPAVAEKAEKQEPLKAKPVEKTTVINNYYGSTPNQAINRSAREPRPVQNVYEYRDDRRNDSNLTDAITTGVIAGVTSAIVEEVIDSYQHNDTQTHYVEPARIVEETPVVEEKVDSVSFVGFDSSKTIDEPVYNTRYESEPVSSSYESNDSGSWGGGSDSGD